MKIAYPDYSKSLLSVTASVLNHYGAHSDYHPLPELDEMLRKNYKNIVLMLFDGLGTAVLEKHLPKTAFLRRYFKDSISSVFPPTTTAATTAIETGEGPARHGWLGWNLYFDGIGAVDLFSNELSASDGVRAADYSLAEHFLPRSTIYEKIQKATGGTVRAINVSYFSEYRTESISEICDAVKQLCREDDRKYIYTYWSEPDSKMHILGTGHPDVTDEIEDMNRQVECLCRELEDTLVIVTADHGMTPIEWRSLDSVPALIECLRRPPVMEPRAVSFWIHDGMHRQFENEFQKAFGDSFLLFSKKEALEKQLFGIEPVTERVSSYIGDYIAAAAGKLALCSKEFCPNQPFTAHHAGLTADEMAVPFIAVER